MKQPFAEMIISGQKPFEYRSVATRIRERVYIYAAKGSARAEAWTTSGYSKGRLPTGVIVGTVEIVGCEGEPGNYAWALSRPQRARQLIAPQNHPQPMWFNPFDPGDPRPLQIMLERD